MRFTGVLLGLLLSCLSVIGQDLHLRYPLPPGTAVETVESTTYRQVSGRDLQFDLYRPQGSHKSPIVIFLNGVGSEDLKRWPIYRDWGRVVTARGLAGLTMDSRRESVADDFRALVDYLHAHANDLRVDADNILVWSCSANVTAGLPIVMDARNREIKAAVVYYGAGEVKEFRLELPLLYVRVGPDDPGQNKAIDALAARALVLNAPFTIVNLPAARHAFDALDDDPVTRHTVGLTLDFMEQHAQSQYQQTVSAGIPMGKAASAVYREDWPAAIEAFRAIAEAKPADSELRRRYGDALSNGGQYKAAIAEYERSIAAASGPSPWTAYSAAKASIKLGESENAMRFIEQFKDIAPLKTRLARDEAFASLRDNPRFREITGLEGR